MRLAGGLQPGVYSVQSMKIHLLLLLVPALSAQPISLTAVDRLALPCDVAALQPLAAAEISAAVGEYESLAILVDSAAPLRNEMLRIEGLPRHVASEIRVVNPYRRKVRNGEVNQPYLLEAAPSVSLEPGKAVYWLTLRPQPGIKPGRYAFTVRLRDAALEAALHVRPFRLRRDPKVFYGAFCGGRDTGITPAHLRDLHERGFDALQFFWGAVSVPVTRESDRMKLDFSRADRWMAEFQKAGMRGPVVWSLGNDATSHTENMLSQVFDIPRPPSADRNGKQLNFADITHPELNRRLKELMLGIRNNALAKKWPEIVFIIYDEPTERLMAEHENRYKFIKSFWPELRIYGVAMNRLEWAKAIDHMVDIQVANGDFTRIRDLATRSGKPFWLYGSASSRDEAGLRHSYGWRPWAHGAESIWFWAYNYHSDDPYNDFDGRLVDSSASMVWPPRTPGGPLVYSVSWDGMREAIDDMAYIQTLEWMLAQSKSTRAGAIRASLQRIREAIPAGKAVRVQGGDAHDTVEVLDARKFVGDARAAVAGWITELLGAEKDLYREIRATP